jgi:D-amino-acid dehydrogenase
MNDMARQIAVLGAGMVGVSSALALQRKGFAVTLIDRKPPGRETSYGNAGIISRGSVLPINNPGLWKSLPAYLGNNHPALRYRLGYLAANLPWLARFLAGTRASDTDRRSVALDGLLASAVDLHRRWMQEAEVSHRLRETGWLRAWRNEASQATAEAEAAMMARFGLKATLLDRQAISGLEPDLAPVFSVGVLHEDTASVDSPGNVTAAYAALFAREGGTIRRDGLQSLEQKGDGWLLHLDSGQLAAETVVLALGPWTADALKPLGYHVPLGFERGYHQEFTLPKGMALKRPVYDGDNAYVLTPVENGVRVTTGVELADRDAGSNLAQRDRAVAKAREIFPFEAAVAEPWRGARPTLPDSLPAIGKAPRHANLYVAFGHQHIGFTTGPSTGMAIAALVAGEAPPFDLTAFAPSRYL